MNDKKYLVTIAKGAHQFNYKEFYISFSEDNEREGNMLHDYRFTIMAALLFAVVWSCAYYV
jgi:hypothetical protein